MKISFYVKESIQEILDELHANEEFVKVSKEGNLVDEYRLHDEDFPGSYAHFSVRGHVIVITTAWSGYEYILQGKSDGTSCRYNGAYRGLLEQELLPTLTPVNLDGETEVESSFGKMNLRLYAHKNAELNSWKRENNLNFNYHDHPRVVKELIFS